MSRTVFKSLAVLGCALVPLLAGCGSKAGPEAGGSGFPPGVTGCVRDADSTELFVQDLYNCDDDKTLYKFATEDAKKNWQSVAKEFGIVASDEGDKWVLVLGDN